MCVCVCGRRSCWGIFGGRGVGSSHGPIEPPDRQLTMPRPLGGHKGPQRHRQPPPNLPALYICAGTLLKEPPPFSSLFHYSAPAPIMHHLFSSVSQEKGRPFVASHSVTQTQDRRLPATKCSPSLEPFTLLALLMSTRGGKGPNSYFRT